MTDTPASDAGEGGFKARAGALTLLYLASPMERRVLLTLLAEATTGAQVLDELEAPDPDDPAAIAAIFNDAYLVEPADPDLPAGTPIGPDTMLQPTPAGREVPFVGVVLQRWLDSCPDGPVELGPDAGPVLAPLLTGWCSMVTHALAAKPLTAVETHDAIQVLDLDTVQARIESMEEAGQLEALPGPGGEPRYAVTEWLRMGIAPLAAAARMELRHPPGDTAAIAALDVEASFLLTLPLLELPAALSGSCSMAVELDEGVSGSPAGVTAQIENGRVVSCEQRLDDDADAWATGSAADWLDTLIEPDVKLVRSGGNDDLPVKLINELHRALFGDPV
ncbi:MAG TPA: hypothetical protein VK471_02345 [Solirubrobacterales bacterium]|nr:hypothetical protein [Solirubrobacterales bacterium]